MQESAGDRTRQSKVIGSAMKPHLLDRVECRRARRERKAKARFLDLLMNAARYSLARPLVRAF